MHFVYGGSSTPTPSPRIPRKQLQTYGRPLLPGYAQSTQVHHRTTSKDRKDSTETEGSLRDAIPAMRRPVAITCLVLNILLPGLGTFVAGLTVLCGSVIRQKEATKQKTICSNTMVAFLQFATAFLFLLGWIWSIVWGVAFITISNNYFKEFKRPSMPVFKARSVDQSNGSDINLMARAGSTPMLTTATHLKKPKSNMMMRSSSADHPQQPVLIAQNTPVSSHSESSLATKKTHNEHKARHHHHHHQKGAKKPLSEEELSHGSSSHDRLEQIVIHNLPKAPARRGILRREDTVTSTGSNNSGGYENQYA